MKADLPPECKSNEEAISLIMQAIEKAGYRPGEQVMIGLDAASSEFYSDGKYHLAAEGVALDALQFADYLQNWVGKYPIISIEDGMQERDWAGWKELTDRIGDCVQLTGDDLFVTNTRILQKGIDQGVGNSILIKFNQIGTLSENPGCDCDGATGRIQRHDFPPLRRYRGYHHCRPGSGDIGRADQKPVPCAARKGWQSTIDS